MRNKSVPQSLVQERVEPKIEPSPKIASVVPIPESVTNTTMFDLRRVSSQQFVNSLTACMSRVDAPNGQQLDGYGRAEAIIREKGKLAA